MTARPFRTCALILALGITPAAARAQLVHGNPGQAENNAPESRTYRAADEAANHPRRNPRRRVCHYVRTARHQTLRHCTWK